MPMPKSCLPVWVWARHFKLIHKGIPVKSSSKIAPIDHISYDQGSCILHRFDEFVPLASVF